MANRFAFSLNRKENRLIWVAYLQITRIMKRGNKNVLDSVDLLFNNHNICGKSVCFFPKQKGK